MDVTTKSNDVFHDLDAKKYKLNVKQIIHRLEVGKHWMAMTMSEPKI